MGPSETIERLPRKKKSALEVSPEVVGRNLVHQFLDGLGRALSSDLVVP